MRNMWLNAVVAVAIAAAGCSDDDESDSAAQAPPAAIAPSPAQVTIPAPAGAPAVATASGYFNGDASRDLVVLNSPGSASVGTVASVSIYAGPLLSGSTPTPVESYVLPPAASDFAVGDFDGNGAADFVVAVKSDSSVSPSTTGHLKIVYRTTVGTLMGESVLLYGMDVTDVTTADVNGDGRVDILASNAEITGVLFGQGAGSFGAPNWIWDATRPVTGDFNADGRADIAVVSTLDPTTVEILQWNQATGGLAAASTMSFPASVTMLATGDITGDGLVDLVVGTNSGFRIMQSNGGFSFTASSSTPSGIVGLLAIGDMNGDGTLDVTCWHAETANVSTHVAGGSPLAYIETNSYHLALTARDLVTVDIDGDGRADTIVSSGSVNIYTGQ